MNNRSAGICGVSALSPKFPSSAANSRVALGRWLRQPRIFGPYCLRPLETARDHRSCRDPCRVKSNSVRVRYRRCEVRPPTRSRRSLASDADSRGRASFHSDNASDSIHLLTSSLTDPLLDRESETRFLSSRCSSIVVLGLLSCALIYVRGGRHRKTAISSMGPSGWIVSVKPICAHRFHEACFRNGKIVIHILAF